MKVTNWRRKLAARLAACGLLSFAAAQAAELNTNLVTNPGFENVNLNSSQGGYNAVEILDWTAGSQVGFAYSHDGSLDGAGVVIPDYANGGVYTGGNAPAGTGSFYFTPNATPGDITAPGQFSQNILLSGGPSGALIASGEAAVTISAFFSSFLANGDFGNVYVDFLDASNHSLGSVQVADNDTTNWSRNSTAGLIPSGTVSAQVSLFGTPLSGGPDGYIDNVDVQVTSASAFLMFLEVNTTTGGVVLKNQTGAPVHIDYYEIVSSGGNTLNPVAWNSLQDQNRAGFPSGDGTGNGWEEAGGSDSGVVGESYLLGSSSVANQASIGLGNLFKTGQTHDLTFRYGSIAESTTAPDADFDADNEVDGRDFLTWQRNFGRTGASKAQGDANGDGNVGAADLARWADEFGAGSGPAGTSQLVTGFVRYVSAASAATSVPEPSGVLLIVAGLLIGESVTNRKRTVGTHGTRAT